jgi:F-type H+-transporting ATPase subunit delta
VPDRRRAWARALFLAAPDRDSRAAYGDALEGLTAAFESLPRLRELLAEPASPRADKSAVLSAALDPALPRASAEVFGRFCAMLVEKNRSTLLPEISRSYSALRDADEGRARLEIEAARTPDAATVERIARAWSAYSGAKSTQTSVRVNQSLIAGYRLRAGSLRIDYSVAGRLERIRRELARPLGPASTDAASGGSARGEG